MKNILIIIITLLLFSSCIKQNNLPPVPKIEFLSFNAYSIDSAECTVSFQDGDGDVGILSGDTVPNMILLYYYKDETTGNFLTMDDPLTTKLDSIDYEHKIPNLTPEGQNKTLEGEIKARFSSLYFFPGHKIIKYSIYIKDRAGNKSNVVYTNEIITPQ